MIITKITQLIKELKMSEISFMNRILCIVGLKDKHTLENSHTSSIDYVDQVAQIQQSKQQNAMNINASPHQLTKQYLDRDIQHTQSQNHLLKNITYASLASALLLTAGLIYVGLQAKSQPYLLVLDNQGRELNAVQVKKDMQPSQLDTIRESQLMNLILNFRTVTPDAIVQKRLINSVMAMVMPNSSADVALKKYLNDEGNSPYNLAKTYTVTPQMINIYPITEGKNRMYQFEWQETWRDRQGNELRTDTYKGMLKYELRTPIDAQTLRQNPSGTWITNITYAQNLDPKKQ
jgi:type IV secretion system protein TrbF